MGGCLALLAGTGLAAAQSEAAEKPAAEAPAETAPQRLANGTRFGAWTLRCEAVAVNETACVLSQRLLQRDGNRFLSELIVFPGPKGGDKDYIAARVPLGTYFPSGFVMRVGESEDRHEFVWQACDRERCEALLELTPDLSDQMEAAGTAVVGYRPSITANPLVFKVDTKGAKAGLDALKAAR